MTRYSSQSYTLADLARRLGATLHGEGAISVDGLSTLQDAGATDIAFLANHAYLKDLASTRAAAVMLHPDLVSQCPVPALAIDNPYLGYAHLSRCFAPILPSQSGGIHPTAVIDDSARLGSDVTVAAHAVIGAGVTLADRVTVGANSVIGDYCTIGENSLVHPGVTIYHGIVIGSRVIIHGGAVIGGDGFGFAHDGSRWHKIEQLGGVIIGDDVEVGSCTSIDRGALDDTIIGDDVKIDSQVQIAHNVHIGDHSALAGCVGIAGSTHVGRHCQLGGGVGLAGHLTLCDGVNVTGMSLVTNSIEEPGIYSSGTGSMPNALWRKNAVRFKQLDQLARRITRLERHSEGE
ncbi:UDP-3-O-[3-hydroxymyristoyl] glucosamine N-acyltransferase [Kushneria avicenniae]|uniref:UDP-3-O-acylglucosamine N-acyltransferase n=1 Tax=Kushneria avicenniae TaxID=402385 RepID=A0A1I1HXN0_9GAMM|nr:UDP-3-O-(3-hydroxymyristoyl)glucosamine N-acyltransferase [Kushneria avicenniae]SFC28545.1 UDP-3-O-[3-hydroxymyristoyl] glucosamine N-acyltransferase [Kushneria avicenniae]